MRRDAADDRCVPQAERKISDMSTPKSSGKLPLYEQLQRYVIDRIESGKWLPGHRMPTEFDFVSRFGMSRPTVHRALHDLMQKGLIHRTPGAGTFVAEVRPQLDLLELHNIADDIRRRGHTHSSEVHVVDEQQATHEVAAAIGLVAGSPVYHSVIVHLEGYWPVQLEERFVNPQFAPRYLNQDFSRLTTNAYLMTVGQLDRVEHTVEAIRTPPPAQKFLRIPQDEPCLLLRRRTWSGGLVASYALLTHPGSRYRLGARFDPPPVKSRLTPGGRRTRSRQSRHSARRAE